MDDVKPNIEPQAESEPAVEQNAPEQTADTPEVSPDVAVQEKQERMVPITALQEERKKRQEIQRQLAEKESAEALNRYDPEDLDNILQHPMVQEMILKEAKRELTDYAREIVDQYPTLHPQVKNAILKNARGFVNETTSDLETAKVDLLEYIEDIASDAQAEQAQVPSNKGFRVASTNVPTAEPANVRPADIVNILGKPVDTWTDEEAATVEAYSKKSIK